MASNDTTAIDAFVEAAVNRDGTEVTIMDGGKVWVRIVDAKDEQAAEACAGRLRSILAAFAGRIADHAITKINPPPSGIELIYFERNRQRMEYSDAHDDAHARGELSQAASTIAGDKTTIAPQTPDWALDISQKHKGDRIKQLAIAGALIAAEIERLQRNGYKADTYPSEFSGVIAEIKNSPAPVDPTTRPLAPDEVRDVYPSDSPIGGTGFVPMRGSIPRKRNPPEVSPGFSHDVAEGNPAPPPAEEMPALTAQQIADRIASIEAGMGYMVSAEDLDKVLALIADINRVPRAWIDAAKSPRNVEFDDVEPIAPPSDGPQTNIE